jgi:serine/threonine-protein kinase RsbW
MKAKLTVPCAKSQLKKIRHFVRNQLNSLPISDLEKDRIILAIDEASSNAIIHGNKCDSNKNIKIIVQKDQSLLKVKIYDIGEEEFNPVLHYRKDMNELIKNRQKGGMGLKLIHDVMDEVDYYKQNDKSVCALIKRLENSSG